MEYFIKYLERKIEACDELGGLVREKAVYQSVLKDYRKAINVIQCSTQLLCVNTHETWDITEDKLYEKIGENQREYIITDDKGKRAKFFKSHFEEIQM